MCTQSWRHLSYKNYLNTPAIRAYLNIDLKFRSSKHHFAKITEEKETFSRNSKYQTNTSVSLTKSLCSHSSLQMYTFYLLVYVFVYVPVVNIHNKLHKTRVLMICAWHLNSRPCATTANEHDLLTNFLYDYKHKHK